MEAEANRVDYVGYDVRAPLPESVAEKMSRDPMGMYVYSLRTHSRLPDRLHESMLLFSFDPAFSECVRLYLDWAYVCEERERITQARMRMEALQERILLFSALIAAVLLVSTFLLSLVRD